MEIPHTPLSLSRSQSASHNCQLHLPPGNLAAFDTLSLPLCLSLKPEAKSVANAFNSKLDSRRDELWLLSPSHCRARLLMQS